MRGWKSGRFVALMLAFLLCGSALVGAPAGSAFAGVGSSDRQGPRADLFGARMEVTETYPDQGNLTVRSTWVRQNDWQWLGTWQDGSIRWIDMNPLDGGAVQYYVYSEDGTEVLAVFDGVLEAVNTGTTIEAQIYGYVSWYDGSERFGEWSAVITGASVGPFDPSASGGTDPASPPGPVEPSIPPTTGGGIYGRNLVINGDAEAGQSAPLYVPVAIPGWEVERGLGVASYADTAPLFPPDFGPPNRGNNFFAGLRDVIARAIQRQDVSAAAAAIDAGQVTFDFEAWLGGYAGQDDSVLVELNFLDANGTALNFGPQLS